MGRFSVSRLVAAGVLVVAMLLGSGVVVLRNIRLQHEDARWVAHSHEVLTEIALVLSLAKDAETGQRGYLITGAQRYLEPYNTALSALQERVDRLERLTGDNPTQHARLPELRARLDARLTTLAENLRIREEAGLDATRERLLSDRGKKEMDELRATAAVMTEHEQQLLAERSQAAARAYRFTAATAILAAILVLAAFAGFLLVLRADLALRTETTQAIAEHRERLRTTLASIGDAVISTDVDGRITTMNGVAESLTGWTTAGAVGQQLTDVFNIVNETTRRPVQQPIEQVLREGVIVGLANHTVLIARDGTERAIEDSAAPIRCAEGKLVGCVLVFRDITERRLAEERERQLHAETQAAIQQFRAFFDQGAMFAGIMRCDGTLVEINRLALDASGFIRDQVIGKLFWDCPWWTPSSDLVEQVRAATMQAASGTVFQGEMPYHTADGRERMVSVIIAPIVDDAGKIAFLAPIGTDVTDRRELEKQLRRLAADLSESNRRKDEFLAMLAHELRNPLAPIRNALTLIRQNGSDGNDGARAFAMVERQVEHLVRLVDDLLDVNRISRGKIDLRTERVDLGTVVQHAVEANRSLVDCARHQLTVLLPENALWVQADPVRLAQVVGNLLSNACKYSEPGSRVEVALRQEGDEAVMRVRDTGMGIASEHLTSIFEMFRQIDASLERSQGGLGIGLTLVKNLVELHGGRVEAFSDGIGHGSELVVRLPIAASVLTTGSSPPARAANVARRSRRILVVDDNRDAAESLATLLALAGHETHTAFDGLEAVDAVARLHPDVVLLDIGLPKLNGYEVARRVRQQSTGNDVVIIALTGWGQDEDRQRAKAAGFDSHLVKPVDIDRLAQFLDGLPVSVM